PAKVVSATGTASRAANLRARMMLLLRRDVDARWNAYTEPAAERQIRGEFLDNSGCTGEGRTRRNLPTPPAQPGRSRPRTVRGAERAGPVGTDRAPGQPPVTSLTQSRYGATCVYAVTVCRSLVEATPTCTLPAIIGPPESPPAVMPSPRRAQTASPPR